MNEPFPSNNRRTLGWVMFATGGGIVLASLLLPYLAPLVLGIYGLSRFFKDQKKLEGIILVLAAIGLALVLGWLKILLIPITVGGALLAAWGLYNVIRGDS